MCFKWGFFHEYKNTRCVLTCDYYIKASFEKAVKLLLQFVTVNSALGGAGQDRGIFQFNFLISMEIKFSMCDNSVKRICKDIQGE